MKTYSISLMILLTVNFGLQAQNEFMPRSKEIRFGMFRVIATTVQVGQRIYIGKAFNRKDTVYLDKRRYIALLHYSGGTIEINRAGVYSMGELQRQLIDYQIEKSQKLVNLKIKNSQSISYKYITFPSGTVSRHLYPGNFINIHLPNVCVIQSHLPIYWKPIRGVKRKDIVYDFELTDEFDKVLQKKTIKDTFMTVTLPKLKPTKEEDYYIMKITARAGNVKRSSLRTQAIYFSKKIYQKGYNYFKEQNLTNKKVVADFMEVFYWSYRDCYLKADRVFRGILKDHPKNKVYQTAYEHFKIYNGLGDGEYSRFREVSDD